MYGREDEHKSVNSSAQQSTTARKSSRKGTFEFAEAAKVQQIGRTTIELMLIFLVFLLLVALLGVVALYLVDHKVIHIFGSSEQTEPAPKLNVKTLAPKVNEATPAPKVNEATPAPKVNEATPAPKVNEATPAPKVNEATPAPKVNETTPSPKVNEATPAPKVNEARPSPKVNEATPAPKVNEATPAPKVHEARPAPKVNEATPDNEEIKTTPAPKVKEFCLTKGCTHAASKIDSGIDYNVKPCDNFYKYACGRWMKENIIPEARSSLDPISTLSGQLEITLKALLEEPIRLEEISSIRKVKTFYASCVDKETIKTRGDTPLKTFLNSQLGGWPLTYAEWNESQFDFLTTWSKLNTMGTSPVLNFIADYDYRDFLRKTLRIEYPTFGIPNPKDYLGDRNGTILLAYENFILSVARLLGLADPATSIEDVGALVDFEIQLANLSVSDKKVQEFNLVLTRMTLEELQNNYSEIFNWTKLFLSTMSLPEIGVGITDRDITIFHSPLFFQRLIPLVQNTTKRTLANYLIWRFVMSMIKFGAIGEKYEDLYTSYKKVIHRGMSNPIPRFRECMRYIKDGYPLVVSRMFVKDKFDQESKVKVLDMVDELKKAFIELIENLDWMDNTTKQDADKRNKLIASKIGYPDEVHNDTCIENLYFNVSFQNDTYLENVLNHQKYYTDMIFRGLGKPKNKDSWDRPASDVNAYFYKWTNQIVFPAGILQPPFYSKTSPMSLNFGGIGTLIGNKIARAFDDRGGTYDKFGNLTMWWSFDAEENFRNKSQCIIDQYGNFTLEQIKTSLNGIKTHGENIADNGGLKQSFRAYRNWVKSRGSEEKDLPGLNFTHNQLFFINFAQTRCELLTDIAALSRVKYDSYSPGEFRVIGSLQNSKDFAEAFNCPLGSYMNPTIKCSVW